MHTHNLYMMDDLLRMHAHIYMEHVFYSVNWAWLLWLKFQYELLASSSTLDCLLPDSTIIISYYCSIIYLMFKYQSNPQ